MPDLTVNIFGDDHGAAQAIKNVGDAAGQTAASLKALETEAAAASAAEQKAATAAQTASTQAAKARDAEADAAGRVRVAETALNEVRDQGNAKASTIAAAEERVATARRNLQQATTAAEQAEQNAAAATDRLTQAHQNAEEATTRHTTAVTQLSTAHRAMGEAADDAGNKVRKLGTDTDSAVGPFQRLSNAARDFKNLDLGGMWTAAALGLPELLGAVGQLSGALGLIPAAAVAVGTAIGAVAVGTQGMTKAFQDSKTAQDAVAEAAAKDTQAQQAVAAANQAATAAGVGNVAALKQQVAEGAAHVASLQAQQAAGQNVTQQLAAAKAAQAANTAELKNAQAATTGNVGALNNYQSAQKTATQAVSEAQAAHRQAAAAVDAYTKAMGGLAPAAQQVVGELISLGPAFTSLRLDVQQALFKGLGQQIANVAGNDLPVLKTGLTQMASAINDIVTTITKWMDTESAIAAWKDIFTNVASAVDNLKGAVGPILQIFTSLAQVGAPILAQLTQEFANAAQKAAEFIQHAQQTGQLKQWIETGVQAVKELWQAFTDVIAIIKNISETQLWGGSFLQQLDAVTGAIKWLTANMPIVTKLVSLFFEAWVFAKVTQGIAGMIGTIGTLVGWLGRLKKAEDDAGGSVGGLGDSLKKNNDVLGTATTAQQAKAQSGQTMAAGETAAANAATVLGSRVTALIGPIALATISVGALSTAIALAATHWPQLSQAATTATQAVVNVITSMDAKVNSGLAQLGSTISQWASSLATNVGNAFTQLQQTATSGITALGTRVAAGLNAITTSVPSWATGFTSAVGNAFTQLPSVASSGLSSLGSAVSTGLSAISDSATTWGPIFAGIVLAAFTLLAPEVAAPMEALDVAVEGGLTGMGTEVETFLSSLAPEFESAFSELDSVASSGMDTIISSLETAASGASSVGSDIASGVEQGISQGWPAVQNFAVQVAEELLQAAEAAIGAASPSTKARDRIGLMFSAGIGVGITQGSGLVTGAITDLLGGAMSHAEGAVGDMWRHWRGGGSGDGGGSGGGTAAPAQSSVPIYALASHLATALGSTGAGTEAVTRMVSGYQNTGLTSVGNVELPPAPPTTGGGGSGGSGGGHRHGPPDIHFHINSGNAGLDQWIMQIIRKSVRVQGGNVQKTLGA